MISDIKVWCRLKPMTEVEQIEYASLLVEGKDAQAFEYLRPFVDVSMKPITEDGQNLAELRDTIQCVSMAHSFLSSRQH